MIFSRGNISVTVRPSFAARTKRRPAERIWAALKNYVANTAVSWPGRLRQIHSFFRARSPDEMLAAAAPWTSPWLPQGYEQNFWNAA